MPAKTKRPMGPFVFVFVLLADVLLAFSDGTPFFHRLAAWGAVIGSPFTR